MASKLALVAILATVALSSAVQQIDDFDTHKVRTGTNYFRVRVHKACENTPFQVEACLERRKLSAIPVSLKLIQTTATEDKSHNQVLNQGLGTVLATANLLSNMTVIGSTVCASYEVPAELASDIAGAGATTRIGWYVDTGDLFARYKLHYDRRLTLAECVEAGAPPSNAPETTTSFDNSVRDKSSRIFRMMFGPKGCPNGHVIHGCIERVQNNIHPISMSLRRKVIHNGEGIDVATTSIEGQQIGDTGCIHYPAPANVTQPGVAFEFVVDTGAFKIPYTLNFNRYVTGGDCEVPSME